ncbi:MAG: tRNA lysidine(34) synthetase TilS [Lachnotalea sp.]
MVNKVLKFINEKNMLFPEDRVIVGVSGGADSICLLNVLLAIKELIPITIYIVHVEHGIRGQESIGDANYVESLAAKYNLGFRKFAYDVQAIATQKCIGIEEMGRILRYQSFNQALEEYNCNKIAVAHNKNDNVETTLLNLFRGSGLKGLSGIPPVRDNIVRPLMCVERREIEQWLEEHQIEYRTDQTNLDDEYTRNKIRLNIIPYVQEDINKQVIAHIDNASNIICEAWEYLEYETDKVYNRCVEVDNRKTIIKIPDFIEESEIIKKNIVRKCIGNYEIGLKDITNGHVESVLALLNNCVGKSIHLPNNLQVKRNYNDIMFEIYCKKKEVLSQDSINIKIPGMYMFEGDLFEFSMEEYEKNQIIPEKTYTKWLDYDKIESDLQLRTRETGDYLEVNSFGGTKKLKSYFIDEKIEKEKRNRIPLLSDDNHVIWVVGYRISEKYKVNDHTKRVLKVQVNEGECNG